MGGAFYSIVRLTCNTLYPAYSSFKAVKSKNVRDYVKWMMYWIVFAFFTAIETVVDPFVFWLPFYSELKIALLLYLVSPVTRGSGVVYRRFLHPLLCYREDEIDAVLTRTRDQGYQTVSSYATRGVSWVASSLLTTAIRGGATVLHQIKRSYSMLELSDLAELAFRDENRFQDVTDEMNSEERPPSSARVRRRAANRKEDLRNRHSMNLSSDMLGSTESLSSGYCSDSFLPVNAETMDTQDYELWEKIQQVRNTPQNARRLQMDIVSDEEDYHYESVATPFGPLKRSGPSGAVSPDVCSSYYPSDRESDDEQDQYHQAQSSRTQSERQTYDTNTYISESRPAAKNGRQSSVPESADLSMKSADLVGRPELTIEDLQLAARRLNLHLVIKEEEEEEAESKKPLPPKRTAKAGQVHDVQGIEGAQQFDILPNPSVELANPSPSLSNHPFQLSSLDEISSNVPSEQSTFQNDAPSRSDDACDISDSEYFEIEETIEESQGQNCMHVATDEMERIEPDPADTKEEENACEKEQVPEDVNLGKQETVPKLTKTSLNPFEDETEDTETFVDQGDSEDDESLISVIQVGKIGIKPANVIMEAAPILYSAPTTEESSYYSQIATAETSALAAKVIKKARAPPPPVVSNSHSSQSIKSSEGSSENLTPLTRIAEDFVARVSVSPADDEGGQVLYRSPGFTDKISLAAPSHYPSLANSPPLSPESRLKRSLALLSDPADPPIKETPVPFQTPTKVLTYSPRQGITRIRSYVNEEESPTRESAKLDSATGDITKVEGTGEASGASRCPHCTIHNWLPHSPSCPKLKKK